jgi:hypothetical protein
VADDDGGAALLARQLTEQLVDERRIDRVELTGRLIREQELRAVRERGADGDPLLLSTRKLAGAAQALVCETDALEELVGSLLSRRPLGARQSELKSDQVSGSQVRIEGTRVMLLDVAQEARAVLGEPTTPKLADVPAEDRDQARGRTVEPGKDAKQSRFARAARPENDKHFPLFDGEGEPLQRSRVSLGRRIDAKHVASLDGGHRATLRVAAQTSTSAAAA